MLEALFGPPDIGKLETRKNVAKLAKLANMSRDPELRQTAAAALCRVLVLAPETAQQFERQIESLDESLQKEVAASLEAVRLLNRLELCVDADIFVQTAGRIAKLNRGAAGVRRFYELCGNKRSEEWDRQVGHALSRHGAEYEELTLDLVQNGLNGPSALYFINQALEGLCNGRKPLKDHRAVEVLAAALSFNDYMVRWLAANALALTADPRAIPPLVRQLMLETNTYVANPILEALRKLGWSPDDISQRVPVLFLSACDTGKGNEELVSNGAVALDYLLRIARTDDHGSATARSLISKIKDPRAVERLLELADTEGKQIRENAVEALQGYRDRAALPELVGALLRSNSKHRWAIARALGNYEDPLAFDTLISALAQRDWDLREEAASQLGNRKDSRALEPLLRLKEEIGLWPDLAPGSEGADMAVEEALKKLGQEQ